MSRFLKNGEYGFREVLFNALFLKGMNPSIVFFKILYTEFLHCFSDKLFGTYYANSVGDTHKKTICFDFLKMLH